MRAAAAFSLLSLITLRAAPGRAQEQRPPEPAADRLFYPPAVDENGDAEEQRPPRVMEGDLDYDVTYDDAVAQTYDDGYDPEAAAQFDETLAPYGNWVDDETYGRVWQPSAEVVGDDFSPYATGGRWALTEYGWTWLSDWDWGWAPFHYGRWLAVADRGWCWMPGTLWGPAWVSWRSGAGYVGWAPLAPRRVSVGSPLGAGSAWRFAAAIDLGRRRGYVLPQQVAPRIFGRMTVVSNARALPIPGATVRVNAGPTFAGMPPATAAATRLAVVAPRALPRRVIEPHPGTPAAMRPWVRAAGRGDESFDGRRGALLGGGDPRPSPGAIPPSPRGPIQPRVTPSGVAPGNRRAPTIHGAPSAMISRVAPGYRGPTVRVSPTMAPRPWAGTPSRFTTPSYAPRPSFGGGRSLSNGYSFGGGGHTSFGGQSSSSFGGGRSSFGGGGGHPAFGGGGRSSFGGGGGGRRR